MGGKQSKEDLDTLGVASGIQDGDDVHPIADEDKLQGRNLMFDDGKSKIDFILAWSSNNKKTAEAGRQAREVFEENLEKEGLIIERDFKEGRDINFVKVHAPWEVLTRYAEFLKVKMPMKEREMGRKSLKISESIASIMGVILRPFELDESVVPKTEKIFSCPYSRDKEYLFDIPYHRSAFFPDSIRIRIVDFILRRKCFSSDSGETYEFGIKKMITDGYYCNAYPLHEGHWKPGSAANTRKLLYDNWANWRMMFKMQPHDHIRRYFGAKIGLYFAWLGFYTAMLLPASIVGLACFIYGLVATNNSVPNQELCSATNLTMCPLCDYIECSYWSLSKACIHVKASRIVDNRMAVFFAIFMSLWGTIFLEFWKRRQAVICYKWDLLNLVAEEEPPRPEFLSRLSNSATKKRHPITGIVEPHVPFWRLKFPILFGSTSTMIFLVALAIGAVIGVIAYRTSVYAALNLRREVYIHQNASIVTSVTAAIINLVIIVILNFVYSKMAFLLTDLECHRTQSEYDNSITLKLFSLQFVNYYSSIIYVAFFKGRFVGRPGKYRTIFGARQEECGVGGCLIELTIQLAIIMVGKQLIQNNVVEFVIPKTMKLVKKMCGYGRKQKDTVLTAWEKDYQLNVPNDNMSLYSEYLEMVVQFGFVTLFVTAFPLAPLFALLNNVIEIRLDASKYVRDMQRPRPEQASDIGIWYGVMYSISRMAILCNAFIIAVTADFIPRLVYKMAYSHDATSSGYWHTTLSHFRVEDFGDAAPVNANNVTLCRYRDFRNPPDHHSPYNLSEMFWHIMAARFIFVVLFENLVVVVTGLLAWLIPDIPYDLRNQINREAFVTSDVILKTELMRAQGSRKTPSPPHYEFTTDGRLDYDFYGAGDADGSDRIVALDVDDGRESDVNDTYL